MTQTKEFNRSNRPMPKWTKDLAIALSWGVFAGSIGFLASMQWATHDTIALYRTAGVLAFGGFTGFIYMARH